MKTLFTLFVFILITSFSFGQTTIWSEDFSGYADPSGIVGPGPVNIGDYPNSNWDLDVSGCTLSASTDWFYVTSGKFSARDLDGEAIWTSKLIDISNFTNIALSVDISEGGTLESDDYIKVYYELNGISQGLFSVNGSMVDDFGSATATHSITSGNNVRIIIKCSNNAGTEYHYFDNISVVGTPASTNSNLSDIVKTTTWSEPQNIDYTQYSAASGLTLTNSIEVASFTIHDGNGTTADADAVSTKLTDLSVDIVNWDNIETIAIFYSTILGGAKIANKGEVTNLTSSTVVFSGLDATALDDNDNFFTLRVTFKDKVTDNDNLKFTIVAATADPTGSVFADADAGGATTDALGDNNKLIVTATKLGYADTPPTSVHINTNFSIKVEATDDNGSRDLDAINAVTLAKYSSTGANTPGTLTSATGLTQNLINGAYLWTDVQFDYLSTFKIEAQNSSLTNVVSGDIDCTNNLSDLIIGVYLEGSSNNKAIGIYNGTGATVDLSNYSIQKSPNGGGFTNEMILSGNLANDAFYVIVNSSADQQLQDRANILKANAPLDFNGNDAIGLFKLGAKGLLDIVGNETSSADFASDVTLVRKKNNISGPSSTYIANDWENYGIDYFAAFDNTSILPIQLLSIKAKQIKESIVINWQTATETNNDYFTIERAIDAQHFEVIGTVRGAGNSNIIKDYQFEDHNASDANVIYYRLKQTDYDGTFTYSKTVSVQANQKELSLLNTYVEGDVLSISLASLKDDAINIEVYDMNGKLVVDKTMDMQKGQNDFSISVANLPQAIYLVRFSNANFIKTQKIFIR